MMGKEGETYRLKELNKKHTIVRQLYSNKDVKKKSLMDTSPL